MRRKARYLAALIAMCVGPGAAMAGSTQQCLSQKELSHVARMGSVMGIGGALNRCGRCLGERYKETVRSYEENLLVEFRRAEASITRDRPNFAYADDLVRMTARSYAFDMSSNCDACKALADTVARIIAEDARSGFYAEAAEKVSKLPSFKLCD